MIRVFIDFGSTFTKAVAFDLQTETLLARVQAPSTADTDVTEGLRAALELLKKAAPAVGEREIRAAEACSSAAGGLRLAVIGLVPDYTTKAGYLAALGAGARVAAEFSYELTSSELRRLEEHAPDLILLTGGTDGGNRRTIVHNAQLLAHSDIRAAVIAAGNKSARDDIEKAFLGTDKQLSFAPNVMPEFGRLELDPVNAKIRELFISRIMDAKGISKSGDIISGVVMPTPAAVLEAAKLLSDGCDDEPGLGELMLADVGGATTDVYSVAAGNPRGGVHLLGLREPYAKRTVEGDLGLYHNIDALSAIAAEAMPDEKRERFMSTAARLRAELSVPDGDAEAARAQFILARTAVSVAVSRHAGSVETRHTPDGETLIQRGKDLTGVRLVIGAGGPLAFSRTPAEILDGARSENTAPGTLAPREPKYMTDSRYILFAVGLLSRTEPAKALVIAKKYLTDAKIP
ncbi:MAG: glutamate mutase L [Oscillospiraceae bacterium]|jgi:uncharacterized protein (TIGR01319 family)|nr:glutamate mutase L [Oscillospiraceae bacterium]